MCYHESYERPAAFVRILLLKQEAFFDMLHFTRKQACAVAASAAFAIAVFSAPIVPAVFALGDPLPSISETPVSEDPFPPMEPVSSASSSPVVSGEPGGDVSGGITPTPDDPSSAVSGSETASGSESGVSSNDASSGETASEAASEAVSSEAVSSEPEAPVYEEPEPVYSKPVTNPNTDQNLIDQLASQAAQANSDPEALSSQDWSILLSQADGGEGGAAQSGDSDTSAGGALLPTDGDGGGSGGAAVSTRSSWLLPAGIVLILFAAAGIGLFVYLQFIQPRRRAAVPPTGGRIDPSADDSYAPEEPQEEDYVDVSSAASREYPVDDDPYAEYARAKEEALAREAAATQETIELSSLTPEEPETPPDEMEDLFSSDETEQLVRSGGTRQTQLPTDPEPAVHAESEAPAEPESPAAPAEPQTPSEEPQGDKPFDWDRFFKE